MTEALIPVPTNANDYLVVTPEVNRVDQKSSYGPPSVPIDVCPKTVADSSPAGKPPRSKRAISVAGSLEAPAETGGGDGVRANDDRARSSELTGSVQAPSQHDVGSDGVGAGTLTFDEIIPVVLTPPPSPEDGVSLTAMMAAHSVNQKVEESAGEVMSRLEIVKAMIDARNPDDPDCQASILRAVPSIIAGAGDDECRSCRDAIVKAGICNEAELIELLATPPADGSNGAGTANSERLNYVERVRDFISTYPLSVTLRGILVQKGPDHGQTDINELKPDKSTYTMMRDLQLYVLNEGLAYNQVGLRLAFDYVIDEIKDGLRRQMWSRIKFDPSKVDAARTLWSEIEGKLFMVSEEEKGLVAAVLKKFIHSVKRKMAGLNVRSHIFVNILGIQNAGKSEFIKRLLDPISEDTCVSNLVQVCDVRNLDLWKHAVLILEELEHASSADIGSIKNRVTSDWVSVRPMGTNATVQVKNRSTMISSTNKSFAEHLRDSTGYRRVAEISYKPDAFDPEAFAAVNAIDPILLWQSVDHTGSDPLDPFREVLRTKQEEMTVPDEVEEWLEDNERDQHRAFRGQGSTDSLKWTDHKQVTHLYYDNYVPWMRNKGRSPTYQCKAFSFVMKRLYEQRGSRYGLERRVNGKKPVTYALNPPAVTAEA
ncbi:MAG: primase-helicase family protein [Betaproteobacteria bacterium]